MEKVDFPQFRSKIPRKRPKATFSLKINAVFSSVKFSNRQHKSWRLPYKITFIIVHLCWYLIPICKQIYFFSKHFKFNIKTPNISIYLFSELMFILVLFFTRNLDINTRLFGTTYNNLPKNYSKQNSHLPFW